MQRPKKTKYVNKNPAFLNIKTQAIPLKIKGPLNPIKSRIVTRFSNPNIYPNFLEYIYDSRKIFQEAI